MSDVDYSEKQYENAANIELGRSGLHVFAPGQVAEAALGYDAAVSVPTPSSRRLMRRLVGPVLPGGTQLSPSHWAGCQKTPTAAQLPTRWVSLLIQYKRPERLKTPPLPAWAPWPPPYYRFALRDGQHDQLLGLEANLGPLARVLYACPCAPDLAHLETAQVRGRVLHITHTVRPSSIGTKHDAWTFKWPRGFGIPNESGPASEEPSGADLVRELRRPAFEGDVFQFLRETRERLDDDEAPLPPRLAGDLERSDLPRRARSLVEDLARLSLAAGRAGAWLWLVGGASEEEPDAAERPVAPVR